MDHDEDEDNEAASLSFIDPNVAAQQQAAAAAAAIVSDDEDESTGKKRKRKTKTPANAPLDKDGLPMEWDVASGQWVEAVGFTAAPEKLTEQWVQTRLSQTLMHLEKLQRGGGVHGTSLITHDEMQMCREALNHALAGVFRDLAAARQMATASAVFWAIALAQSAAAQRPGGWVVDSADAVSAWSMDSLHDFLINFKSETTKVDESGTAEGSGPATRIGPGKGGGRGSGGRGRGGAGFKGAGGGNNEDIKRRRLRVDALGDYQSRLDKLRALNELIRAGGGAGLSTPILQQRHPTVRGFAAPPPAGAVESLPGSAALPGGRGGARAAMLARWGGGAVRKAEERYNGVSVPVLTGQASLDSLGDDDDALPGEDALGPANASDASSMAPSAPPAAIQPPTPIAQHSGGDEDDLLGMLGE